MFPARRYFLIALFGTLAALAAVAAFNRVVDPFWYFRDVEIAGFNAVKTKFRRFERHVKPALVAREAPQALILGSSYAEIGFDPLSPLFTDGGRLSGYNFGMAGADWSMVQCYLEHALERARPRRLLVGLSLAAMPDTDCREQLAEMASPDLASFLISTDALRASIETVAEQRRGVASHTREGLYRYAKDAPGADSRFREFFRAHEQVCPLADLARRHRETLSPALPAPAAGADFSGLRRFLAQAAAQDVEVFLVIYPVHAYVAELGFLCGAYRDHWALAQALARAVEDAAASGARVQLWDFPGYTARTGERVTSGVMRYWQDPRHFNAELGEVLLASMRGAPGAPGERFGYRVTPEAAASEFERVLAERAAYVAAHPWFLPELERLLREAGHLAGAQGGGS